MIDSGEVKSEAGLARKLGISRVRVNQIVRLLKLDSQIIKHIETLGDTLPSQMITERMLRPYIGLPFRKQERILQNIRGNKLLG